MASVNEAYYKDILPTIQDYIKEESTVYYLIQNYDFRGPTCLSVVDGKITQYRWSPKEDLQVCVDGCWMDAEEVYFDEKLALADAKEFS